MDAGSLVYQGREGTGAATIYRGNPALDLFTRQQQNRANQERAQEAARQKETAARNKFINDYTANLDKPGIFQKEELTREIEQFSQKAQQVGMREGVTIGQIYSELGKDREELMAKIAKGKELDEYIKGNLKLADDDKSEFDGEYIRTRQSYLYNKNINEIDKKQVIGITSEPAAYSADKGIVDIANEIKEQVKSTRDGSVNATDYGLEWDRTTNNYRFAVDSTGKISDKTVDGILLADSRVRDRLRWDIAKESLFGGKKISELTEEELNKVNENFEAIRYKDDPILTAKVRQKVRDKISHMQKIETLDTRQVRTDGGGDGDGYGDPTNPVYQRHLMLMEAINYDANPEKAQKVIGLLKGGKIGGFTIIDDPEVVDNIPSLKGLKTKQEKEKAIAEYKKRAKTKTAEERASYEAELRRTFPQNDPMINKILAAAPDVNSTGKVIKLKGKVTTIDGDVIDKDLEIDLSKPEAYEVINSILQSTGNANIPIEKLRAMKAKSKKPSSGIFEEESVNSGNESGIEWN